MQPPSSVRPAQSRGDENAEQIYVAVGRALSAWEYLEVTMAELFDGLVAQQPSNRAAFAAFTAVKSANSRSELLKAAANRAIPSSHPMKSSVDDVIEVFQESSSRRNEIAHGLVFQWQDFGFFLGPHTGAPQKWSKTGEAKFRYRSDDIEYYNDLFAKIILLCGIVLTGLCIPFDSRNFDFSPKA